MNTTQPIDLVTVGSLFMEITPTTPREALTEAHHYTLVAGGAAANVVFALARLGVKLRFITAVGDDEFGTLAANELAAFGVDNTGVRRVPGQLTPVSFCSVDGRGGKLFRFYRFPGSCSPMEMLTAEDFAAVTACRLFDFSEGSIREQTLRPLVFQAARAARAAGVPVLYALNLRRSSWNVPEEEIKAIERAAISLADILVLNAEELAFLTGQGIDDGLREVQALGPHTVVLTQGGDGDVIVRVGEGQAAVPPFHVPVVYDVGAGDTFHAGLVATALRGGNPVHLSLEEWTAAARFAAATAAIRVSTSADPHDLPTYAQVEAWLGTHGGS
ncbi:MAG TPA: PfkB family carbohydrate kinase [Armatimonadota bacterium]